MIEETSRMALEVALHAEVQRYRQYRKLPSQADIAQASSREPADFNEAVSAIAILASLPPGVELEGKRYQWNLEQGLQIKDVVTTPRTIEADDPGLWWNCF